MFAQTSISLPVRIYDILPCPSGFAAMYGMVDGRSGEESVPTLGSQCLGPVDGDAVELVVFDFDMLPVRGPRFRVLVQTHLDRSVVFCLFWAAARYPASVPTICLTGLVAAYSSDSLRRRTTSH